MNDDKDNDNDQLKGLKFTSKRSSLKQREPISPIKSKDKTSKKRRSVNWDQSCELDNLKAKNMKEMKISFAQVDTCDDKRKFSDYNCVKLGRAERFNELRKSSMKNEYTLAKELIDKEKTDDGENEGETLENTKRNKAIGLLIKGGENEDEDIEANKEEDKVKENK